MRQFVTSQRQRCKVHSADSGEQWGVRSATKATEIGSRRIQQSSGRHLRGNGLVSMRRSFIAIAVATAAFGAPIQADAQVFNPFFALPGMPALGGNGGSAAARAIIGIAMSTILQQLSQQERANREAALHQAAMSGSASWKTSGTAGKTASYKKVGEVQTVGNQKCQKVQEKITLANGEQGVSEENVCFD